MGDEVQVKLQSQPSGDERLQPLLCLLGALPYLDPPEPPGDAEDVSIDREDWPAQFEQGHAGGGLRADARQRQEVGHDVRSRHLAEEVEAEGGVILGESAHHFADHSAALDGQSRRPDSRFKALEGC